MAVLTVQQIVRTGLAPTLAAAAAAGDAFPNNGRTFLVVANANGVSARAVTVASQIPPGAIPEGTAKTDLVVSVPASSERWIGPFEAGSWNDANGRVVVTYDDEADITVGATAL